MSRIHAVCRSSRSLLLLLVRWLLVVLLGPLAAQRAEAYERATVDGAPGIYLYWSRRTVSYQLNEAGCADVPAREAIGAVKRAFFSWAAASCTDLYVDLEGLTSETQTNLVRPSADKPDRHNRIVWREQAWPPEGAEDSGLTADIAALTTIAYDAETGEIVDADIDLNGFDFFWTTTDDPTKAATDIQNIMTHEIGHLLGLAHSSGADAAMYADTPQAELSKRLLGQDDLAALCDVYPYGEPTPVGKDQPPPHTGVQGAAAGCFVGAVGAGAGGALPSLVLVIALLVPWCARSACQRRARRLSWRARRKEPCFRSTRASTTR